MKTFFLLLLLLLNPTSYADQKAITDTGEEIIIFNDGTWRYVNDTNAGSKKIEINKYKFFKTNDSSFLLKSKRNNSAYWINPDKWIFKKADNNESAEYEFQAKNKDIYGMAITEEISIPLDSLSEIALSNAKNAVPNIQIIEKEYRIVNGKKVLYLVMRGTTSGINLTYLGYYFSDSSGTTQFLTYTATNLVEKYKSTINDFLNGLISRK